MQPVEAGRPRPAYKLVQKLKISTIAKRCGRCYIQYPKFNRRGGKSESEPNMEKGGDHSGDRWLLREHLVRTFKNLRLCLNLVLASPAHRTILVETVLVRSVWWDQFGGNSFGGNIAGCPSKRSSQVSRSESPFRVALADSMSILDIHTLFRYN